MIQDSDLLKKYNVPGPRYTSYPTVPYWSDSPTEEQWVQTIRQSLDEAEQKKVGAAVYVHIPFCESLCTYCACNTRITRKHTVSRPYIQTVLKEWHLYKARVGKEIPIQEIHLGGGTPTFLTAEELDLLVQGILSESPLIGESEFSVEADPRVTHEGHLRTLHQLGFRRLSFGIQDFDPQVQEIVHRVQSVEQVRKLTHLAREIGYHGLNYDLIYGLPLQTKQSIEHTIKIVRDLRPDRIAFYSYAHVPWIRPGQRRFTDADVPSGDEKRALYETGRQMLEEAGYFEIGMDHFALKTDSLWKASQQNTLHRNFMGYTARQVSPLIGLGTSAIGDSWYAFSQNEKLVETYQARIEKGELPLLRGHVLNSEDLILRRHILNLMTQLETRWTQEHEKLIPTLSESYSRLREFEADGLLRLSPGHCQITEKGRAFLRNICMAFDARLITKAPATSLFSKTI